MEFRDESSSTRVHVGRASDGRPDSSILAGFGLQAIQTFTRAQSTATGLPSVQEDAVRLVTMVADNLKNAPDCTATSGCNTNSVFSSVAASSMVIYTAASGTTRTYRLQSGSFQRIQGNAGTPDLTIPNVTSLTLNYFTSSTGAYNVSTGPNSWSGTIATANLKNIAAVRISVTITRGGLVGKYTTDVRLRNSPVKV